MIGRWIRFGLVYILLGLPIGYMWVTSGGRSVWLIVFGFYFIAAALVGNWYVFFAGRRDMAAFVQYALLGVLVAATIALGFLLMRMPDDPLVVASGAAVLALTGLYLAWLILVGRRQRDQ